MNYTALKTELTTDPLVIGYASTTDPQAADLLNAIRSGQTVNRDIISTWEILEATVLAEWTALSAAEKQRYQTIISAGTVSVKGANIRAAFAGMFSALTQTRTNLLALQTRTTSRAEVLFGTSVSLLDVHIARRTV